jgi:hypothetical protein
MPIEVVDASGALVEIRVRGMMKRADLARIVQVTRESIAREGRVRALILLEDFEGWERQEDWGDVSFVLEQGQHVEKMAIVGDERWRDRAFAFTAKGFRPTAIEFFIPSRTNQARTWLDA